MTRKRKKEGERKKDSLRNMCIREQKSLHLIIWLDRYQLSLLHGKRVDLGRANTESYSHICHMATVATTTYHARSVAITHGSKLQ